MTRNVANDAATLLGEIVAELRDMGLPELDQPHTFACPMHDGDLGRLSVVPQGSRRIELVCTAGCDANKLIKVAGLSRFTPWIAESNDRKSIDSDKRQRWLHGIAVDEYRAELAGSRWAAARVEGGTLTALLETAVIDEPHLLDGLQKQTHNVVLTAQYKTGKTTFALAYAKALVDGEPFLNRGTVLPDTRRIGWWNGEMDAGDLADYARPLKVRNGDRIEMLQMRGVSMSVMDDDAAERAVEWLRGHKVALWVIDSWRRVCASCGVDENSNADVERLTARIDEIKRDAGVGAFLTLAHTGRGERAEGSEHARGATALNDWVDVQWVLTRSGGERFFAAEGRVIGQSSTRVLFDEVTRSVDLGEGTRSEVRRASTLDRAVEKIAASPGISTGALANSVGGSNKHTNELTGWLRGAEVEGRVHHRDRKPNGRLWHLGQRPAELACSCGWY